MPGRVRLKLIRLLNPTSLYRELLDEWLQSHPDEIASAIPQLLDMVNGLEPFETLDALEKIPPPKDAIRKLHVHWFRSELLLRARLLSDAKRELWKTFELAGALPEQKVCEHPRQRLRPVPWKIDRQLSSSNQKKWKEDDSERQNAANKNLYLKC